MPMSEKMPLMQSILLKKICEIEKEGSENLILKGRLKESYSNDGVIYS